MEQVCRENPLIFSRGVAITRKLGFPDVIMPGESQLQPHVPSTALDVSTEEREEGADSIHLFSLSFVWALIFL